MVMVHPIESPQPWPGFDQTWPGPDLFTESGPGSAEIGRHRLNLGIGFDQFGIGFDHCFQLALGLLVSDFSLPTEVGQDEFD